MKERSENIKAWSLWKPECRITLPADNSRGQPPPALQPQWMASLAELESYTRKSKWNPGHKKWLFTNDIDATFAVQLFFFLKTLEITQKEMLSHKEQIRTPHRASLPGDSVESLLGTNSVLISLLKLVLPTDYALEESLFFLPPCPLSHTEFWLGRPSPGNIPVIKCSNDL